MAEIASVMLSSIWVIVIDIAEKSEVEKWKEGRPTWVLVVSPELYSSKDQFK